MKNWLTKHIVGFSIAVAIFIILFPWFLNFLGVSFIKNNYNIISDSSSWVGFFGGYAGAIIGGLIAGGLTLGGVILTLNSNKNQSKDDKRISVIPYLRYDLLGLNDDFNSNVEKVPEVFLIEPFTSNPKCKNLISVENLGLGTAIDFNIVKIANIDNYFGDNHLIKAGEKVHLYIEIDYKAFNKIEHRQIIKIFLKYKDILGNTYEQEIDIEVFKVIPVEDGAESYTPFVLFFKSTYPCKHIPED